MKPIRIEGRVNVPKCSVLTLEVKDRFDLVVGRPIIMNGDRYVVTGRQPLEFTEEGAQVFVVLGLDNRQKRPKSESLERLLGHKKHRSIPSPDAAPASLLTDASQVMNDRLDAYGFDPADHPDAGGPAGASISTINR